MDFNDVSDDALNELMDTFCDENTQKVTSDTNKNKTPGQEHLEVLTKYFGHQNFRNLQWEIISAIIYDKRDVCAIMSTGYGKSLCFQYPSVFLGALTLVISPLIALMEDQVLSLQFSNIPACLLGTAQKKAGIVVDDIFKNKYNLVYLTPEFCTGDVGVALLKRIAKELKVVLIAVDEAHCISSWGHDFRYQYRQLGILRDIFENVPIIAVTATATSKVREDIITSLKLQNPLHVCTGFDRPNIYLEVNFKSPRGVFSDLMKVMVRENSKWKFSGPTIVYCITRKETEEVAQILRDQGINSLPYHAGLSLESREKAHELFVKDKIQVIVATIAFGMGIDKPDIRNIVHYGCSKSIENYYQEVGRAGRDGLPAQCITFYSKSDFTVIRYLNSQTASDQKQAQGRASEIETYLTGVHCRRRFILEHFEDKVDHLDKPRKACCDVCTNRLYDTRSMQEKYEGIDENGCYDFTDNFKIFLKSVAAFNSNRFGLGIYILFIRGSNSSKLHESKRKHPLFGSGKTQSEAWWQAISRILVQEKYLSERMEKTSSGFSYSAITLTEKGRNVIYSSEKILIPPPSTILKLLKQKASQSTSQGWVCTSKPINTPPTVDLRPLSTLDIDRSPDELEDQMALYHRLLDRRGEIASQLDCMPYMVASNAALMTISRTKPTSLNELRQLNLDGYNEAKIHKFGNKFLEVIVGKSDDDSQNSQLLSIKDILALHPLPDVSLPLTARVSCTMSESGLTVGEIAEKRGVTKSTIVSHLVSGMKFGYPIKIIELGTTEEARDTVISVYRKFHKTGFSQIKLTTIKEQCPPEITWDDVKGVLAYLQVRCHLQTLDIPYEEFEDFHFNDVDGRESTSGITINKELNGTDKAPEQHKLETDRIVSEMCESPAKKFKPDHDIPNLSSFDSILDSPPRQCSTSDSNTEVIEPQIQDQSVEVQEQKTGGIGTKKSKGRALPPWLVVKKIN